MILSILLICVFFPAEEAWSNSDEFLSAALSRIDPCRLVSRDRHRWRNGIPITPVETEMFRQCALTFTTSYRPSFAMMVASEAVSPSPLPASFKSTIVAAYNTRAVNDRNKLVVAENYVDPQYHSTVRFAASAWLLEVANSTSPCRHAAMHIAGTFELLNPGSRLEVEVDALDLLQIAAAQRYVPAMIDFGRIVLSGPTNEEQRIRAYAHLLHADAAGAAVDVHLSKFRGYLSAEALEAAVALSEENQAAGRTIKQAGC